VLFLISFKISNTVHMTDKVDMCHDPLIAEDDDDNNNNNNKNNKA